MNILLEECHKKKKAKQEEQITLAYITAMWAAQWFSKKQPKPLKQILEKLNNPQPQKKQMTDQEMFATVQMLHKALGGEKDGCG